MAKSILVLERLKELFSYDGETGPFTRLVTVGNNVEGKIAGAVRPRDGYIQIRYRAHVCDVADACSD